MEKALENKIVLITGSSIGIGAATAKEFAKEGAKIVITYNSNREEAEKVEKECRELGASSILVTKLDVTKDDEIKRVVKETTNKFGQIDILINNSGVLYENKLLDMSFSEIEEQVRVNLEGLIKMTKEALPSTKEAVINIASLQGFNAYPTLSTYNATKWAIRGFSKSLTGETEVPIYIVNPGGTATQMNDFEGVAPEKVGQVIVDVVKGKIKADSGDDINVWEH